jgi:hypothetical protein
MLVHMNSPRGKYSFALAFLLLISVGFNVYAYSATLSEGTWFSIKRSRESINLPLSQSANCSFNAESDVTYKNGKVEFSDSKSSEPMNISFIDLDTDKPKMRGNGGQDDLIKIVDNAEVVTLVEAGPVGAGTLQSFSIFKASGVGIWTKQYNLAAQIPFGLLSMGFCD